MKLIRPIRVDDLAALLHIAETAGAGKLLSKCRFLFMANHPQRFAKKVIAEMRGVSDEHGHSPFWEGLGRHWTTMRRCVWCRTLASAAFAASRFGWT